MLHNWNTTLTFPGSSLFLNSNGGIQVKITSKPQ